MGGIPWEWVGDSGQVLQWPGDMQRRLYTVVALAVAVEDVWGLRDSGRGGSIYSIRPVMGRQFGWGATIFPRLAGGAARDWSCEAITWNASLRWKPTGRQPERWTWRPPCPVGCRVGW